MTDTLKIMPDYFIYRYGKSGLDTSISCTENFSNFSYSGTSQDSQKRHYAIYYVLSSQRQIERCMELILLYKTKMAFCCILEKQLG